MHALGFRPSARCLGTVSPSSSFGLVDLTMQANHVYCVAPSIADTGFPDSKRQDTALGSPQHMW